MLAVFQDHYSSLTFFLFDFLVTNLIAPACGASNSDPVEFTIEKIEDEVRVSSNPAPDETGNAPEIDTAEFDAAPSEVHFLWLHWPRRRDCRTEPSEERLP